MWFQSINLGGICNSVASLAVWKLSTTDESRSESQSSEEDQNNKMIF